MPNTTSPSDLSSINRGCFRKVTFTGPNVETIDVVGFVVCVVMDRAAGIAEFTSVDYLLVRTVALTSRVGDRGGREHKSDENSRE